MRNKLSVKLLLCCMLLVSLNNKSEFEYVYYGQQLTVDEAAELSGFPKNIAASILILLNAIEKVEQHGWHAYQNILAGILKHFKLDNGIGCEVGVASGAHSYQILKNTNVKKLYSVDPYKFYGDPTNTGFNNDHFEVLYHKVVKRLSEFGDRTQVLRLLSSEAASHFKKHELDFVFLDANHLYEYVKEDLNLWYEKVKPGGIVAGDDYHTMHPGVPLAVNEFFAAKNLPVNQHKEILRFWWVYKPLTVND